MQANRGDISDIMQPGERVVVRKVMTMPDGRKKVLGYFWKDTGEEISQDELERQGRRFIKSKKLTRRRGEG